MVQNKLTPSIELHKVTCHFDQYYGIHDISFILHKGKLLSICGPSGSGKTTLLRLIAGLEPPDSGVIQINGSSVSTPDATIPPHRRHCAMIFQNLALWPHMTVAAHLHFILPYLSKSERLDRVTLVLNQVKLANKADNYPHHLSGGEQQRLAIARAIAGKPDILLMDEPFSSLDFRLKKEMMGLLSNLRNEREMTVLYVTHNLDEIMHLSDNVLVMEKGDAVFFGSKAEFAHQFENDLKTAGEWMRCKR